MEPVGVTMMDDLCLSKAPGGSRHQVPQHHATQEETAPKVLSAFKDTIFQKIVDANGVDVPLLDKETLEEVKSLLNVFIDVWVTCPDEKRGEFLSSHWTASLRCPQASSSAQLGLREAVFSQIMTSSVKATNAFYEHLGTYEVVETLTRVPPEIEVDTLDEDPVPEAKLWELRWCEGTRGPCYDVHTQFLIAAQSHAEARTIAQSTHGDEKIRRGSPGREEFHFWTDETLTSCRQIGTLFQSTSGIVCASFNAG